MRTSRVAKRQRFSDAYSSGDRQNILQSCSTVSAAYVCQALAQALSSPRGFIGTKVPLHPGYGI
jgi:hypothetical protein